MPVAGSHAFMKTVSATFWRSIAMAKARRTFTSSKGGASVLNAR